MRVAVTRSRTTTALQTLLLSDSELFFAHSESKMRGAKKGWSRGMVVPRKSGKSLMLCCLLSSSSLFMGHETFALLVQLIFFAFGWVDVGGWGRCIRSVIPDPLSSSADVWHAVWTGLDPIVSPSTTFTPDASAAAVSNWMATMAPWQSASWGQTFARPRDEEITLRVLFIVVLIISCIPRTVGWGLSGGDKHWMWSPLCVAVKPYPDSIREL